MKTIYKYTATVRNDGSFELELPVGFRLLKFLPKVISHHEIDMGFWALVDTDAPTRTVRFEVRESGQDATGLEQLSYLGTLRNPNGTFHIFHEA